jgi:DNA-binding transcriptional MerR regulator/quercetin dioxygenase-like cupin family protein
MDDVAGLRTSQSASRAKRGAPRKSPKSQRSQPAATTSDAPASSGAVYRIQEAAQIAGVSASTVRAWDRDGLVNSYRGSNGYRYFNEEDLQRLRRIAHLRLVERLNVEGIRRALAEIDGKSSRPAQPDGDVAIGPRLRKLRQDAGLTLGQAAERAELSPSFLSALERDQTGVSAQSLHRLAHVYGTTVSALVRRETTELVQLSNERKRSRTSVDVGYIEPLIDGKTLLDAEIIGLEPDGSQGHPYVHEGEELLYMLDGELDVRLATGQQFKLKPGDSLFYPSTIEHEWRNMGRVRARFLWVATPPTF